MESPLNSYASHNLPLPDSLVPLWAREVEDLSQSISFCDQKMAEDVGDMEDLAKKRCELLERKDLVVSFRSAARRLPPELVAHIMFFALELDEKPMGEEERQLFMTLRSVSSLWRRTAWSTPALWRSLEVDIGEALDFAKQVPPWLSRGRRNVHLTLKNTVGYGTPQSVLDEVLPLVALPTYSLTTLVLGATILRQWKCFQALMKPSAAKASVEALSIWLPESGLGPSDPVLAGASIDLAEAFPQMRSLALQGTIRYPPITHPSLTSLAVDNASMEAAEFTRIFKDFPCLEELVIATSRVAWDRPILTSIELPTLKRLALINHNAKEVMRSFTCSSLQWLHLSNIPNAIWFDSVSRMDLIAFIEKSKAVEFTLRLDSIQESLGNLLPRVLARSLPIHRLEVKGIDWLSRKRPKHLFDVEDDIPSSLREILASETPRKLPWISRNVGGERNGAPEGPRRTIDVYFPGGKEESNLLGVRCREEDTQVYLNFHCTSKGAIEHLMHRKNPIHSHSYESLLAFE